MDARLSPTRLLGLQEGDAHVIRNAGGVVSDDAIRSLCISQTRVGTKEILVIQHTDCGMATFTDDEFVRTIEEDTGSQPAWPVHTFTDLEESVRASVARIRESPFIPHTDAVRGFVYDVATGTLREVV
jgi:carbonic anhydrase